MNARSHWETVYGSKAPDAVSWYRPHLETSLALIERSAPDQSASIIDVGGGESTLVDDLLTRGYRNVSVLDISQTALDGARRRLGPAAEQVHWLLTDVSEPILVPHSSDVWHARAVCH
ncbi:MAG: class I SAM-dependent methyltransferase, partial [Bryobacteraceae bacterium]